MTEKLPYIGIESVSTELTDEDVDELKRLLAEQFEVVEDRREESETR